MQASTPPHTKHKANIIASVTSTQTPRELERASVLRRVQGVKRYHDDSYCACAKALLSRDLSRSKRPPVVECPPGHLAT